MAATTTRTHPPAMEATKVDNTVTMVTTRDDEYLKKSDELHGFSASGKMASGSSFVATQQNKASV